MSDRPRDADEPIIIADPIEDRSLSSSSSNLPQPGLLLSVALAFVPQVLQFVVGIAVVIVVMFAFLAVTREPQQVEAFLEQNNVFLLPLGTFTTLVAAVSVAKILYWRDTSRAIGLRGCSLSQGIGLALFLVPLAILASEFTNVLAEVLSWYEPEWLTEIRRAGADTFAQFSEQALVLVLVAGCILPGAGEEILCRGVIAAGWLLGMDC